MNNGLQTERAHRGTFSISSYITIGDMYAKKADSDPRLKGKQFSQACPAQGIAGARPNNSMFDREHKWLYGGEKYVDKTSYLQSQPPDARKKGFGSSDARRRDEFTLDIETEKWRERITKEMTFAEHFAARAEESMTQEERDRFRRLEEAGTEPRWTHGPEFLFDLGKEATGGTTPYEMKDARDTWYSKQRVKQHGPSDLVTPLQHTGGVALSSHAYGENLKGYADWAKPEYARQPIIRDSFFRSTGVLRP